MSRLPDNTTVSPIAAINFLKSLRRHNDREWFNAHKETYLKVQENITALTSALLDGMTRFEPGAASLQPSDCLYRIYRDTRFSPDKTPYKTHIGIYICPPRGKKSERAGYYLHLEPDASLVAAGAWYPRGPLLKELRNAIFDNIEEYLGIIRDPGFSRFYPGGVGDDPLKTAPKGFDKNWEHIGLLKPRSFTAASPMDADDLKNPAFIADVLARMEAGKPLNDFFNFTIDESGVK